MSRLISASGSRRLDSVKPESFDPGGERKAQRAYSDARRVRDPNKILPLAGRWPAPGLDGGGLWPRGACAQERERPLPPRCAAVPLPVRRDFGSSRDRCLLSPRLLAMLLGGFSVSPGACRNGAYRRRGRGRPGLLPQLKRKFTPSSAANNPRRPILSGISGRFANQRPVSGPRWRDGNSPISGKTREKWAGPPDGGLRSLPFFLV